MPALISWTKAIALSTAVLLASSSLARAQDAQPPAADQPAPKTDAPADKPAEDKPAEKPAEQKPADEKPAEEKPADKPAEKPADKPAEKPAEEKKPEEKPAAPAEELKTILLVEHLDNPSGVAIHPQTAAVFITSHQGVFRLIPGRPHKIYLEVEGFKTDVYGKGPKYDISPLGVTCWGNDHLIVSDGSKPDGEELVRIYKIDAGTPAAPRKETDAEFTLGPIAPGSDASPKGEGNFYASVVLGDAIYITSNGDDTKGWVLKSEIKDGKPGELKAWLATKEATQVDAPIAITSTPDGKELVIGQGGEVNVPGDALLTFYNPADGKLVRSLKTGLYDITGLAYAPNGKLYGVDFAWADTKQGGLFEMVIEGDEVKPKKILSLDRPTSLAFDKEGNAYITVFGQIGKEAADGKPAGALIKLPAGF